MIRLFAKSVQRIYMYVYVCMCVCLSPCSCTKGFDRFEKEIFKIDSYPVEQQKRSRPMDETESIDPTSPRTFKDNGNRIDIENLKITRK